MNGRVVRTSILIAAAAAAVGIAGIGLFSVLKFLNLGQGFIYAAAFIFFFGIFFVVGQIIYPALFVRRGVQSIRYKNGESAARSARPARAVVSASRVGSAAGPSAASVVINAKQSADSSFVQCKTAGRSQRATGNLKIVALQSNISHNQVRAARPEAAGNASKNAREEVLAGRGKMVRLIDVSRKRIEALESKMISKLHRITSTGINNLVLAKRMITALERRVSDVDAVLTAANEDQQLTAIQNILTQDLTLADDALSSVVGAKRVPPIRATQVERTLNELISKVAGRRELSGAAA